MREWIRRKVAFVLASSDHGSLIVNRYDYRETDEAAPYGVGFDLLETSSFSPQEVDLILSLLRLRRHYFGDGVFAIDCGANIGVHTIEWARLMTGWGKVAAIEAQERVFYALAGNIALNNCFNARAFLAAAGDEIGTMKIPVLDHLSPASFGSLELIRRPANEFVGQAIDYSEEGMSEVRCLTLDSLGFDRVDLIKLDIEGMELQALAGAREILRRQKPIVIAEFIKSDKSVLRSFLEEFGYTVFEMRMDFVAVHRTDMVVNHIKPKSDDDHRLNAITA